MDPKRPVILFPLPPRMSTLVMPDGTRRMENFDHLWKPAGKPCKIPLSASNPSAVSGFPGFQTSATTPKVPRKSADFMPCFGARVESDLQQMRPETLSCGLIDLDKCHTTQSQPMASVMSITPGQPMVYAKPEPMVISKQGTSEANPSVFPCNDKCLPITHVMTPAYAKPLPKLKVEPKPITPKTKPPSRRRKPLPESMPLFTPLPMGARHIDPNERPWGNRFTKQMWAERKAALSKPNPKACHPDKKTKSVHPTENTNSAVEYEVEYLSPTKIILRKKNPAPSKPSVHQICRKRKFLEDHTEIWRRGKQARVESCDVTDGAGEPHRDVCQSPLSSDTRDF